VATKKKPTKKRVQRKTAVKLKAAVASVWPCTLVPQDDDYSIILTEFGRFEHLTKADAGGYFVQRLARRLAREHEPALLKLVEFDSEASMFCAHGEDLSALQRLAALLRGVATGSEVDDRAAGTKLVPFAEVKESLLSGFVRGLDKRAQAAFWKRAPKPLLTNEQARHLAELASLDAEARRHAGRRIHSEARSGIFKWGHYLSHPATSAALMRALDVEQDEKARQEILCALTWICARHLPDLRAKPYFAAALQSKTRPIRFLAIEGSASLTHPSWPELLELVKVDRVPELRARVLLAMVANLNQREVGMGECSSEQVPSSSARWLEFFLSLLGDAAPNVRGLAARGLASARHGAPALRAAFAKEKDRSARAFRASPG
jgi:hypothetical protein